MDSPLLEPLRASVRAYGEGKTRLALKAGIDPPALYRFQAGKAGLSVGSIEALMRLLGLTLTSCESKPNADFLSRRVVVATPTVAPSTPPPKPVMREQATTLTVVTPFSRGTRSPQDQKKLSQ